MTISQQEKALLAQRSLSKGLSATKRTIPSPNLSPNLVTRLPLRQEDGSSTPAATTITAGTVDKNQISMVKSKRGEGGETTYTLFRWKWTVFMQLVWMLPKNNIVGVLFGRQLTSCSLEQREQITCRIILVSPQSWFMWFHWQKGTVTEIVI